MTRPTDRPAAEAKGAVEHRKARRAKVFVPTELVVADVAMRAHLLDISVSGSRVHSRTAPRAGDDTLLHLNGQTHEARVVWSDAERAGLEFKTELTPEQIAKTFSR